LQRRDHRPYRISSSPKYRQAVTFINTRLPSIISSSDSHPFIHHSPIREKFQAQKNAEERKRGKRNSMQAPVHSCTRPNSPDPVHLKECEKYCQSCHNAPFPSVPTSHLDTGPKGKKIVKWKFQSGKGKAVRVPNEEKS
jgi:hypothetical protein